MPLAAPPDAASVEIEELPPEAFATAAVRVLGALEEPVAPLRHPAMEMAATAAPAIIE